MLVFPDETNNYNGRRMMMMMAVAHFSRYFQKAVYWTGRVGRRTWWALDQAFLDEYQI